MGGERGRKRGGRGSWRSSEVQGDTGGVGEQGTQLLQVLCAFGTLGLRVFPGFICSDSGSRSPGWSQKSAF